MNLSLTIPQLFYDVIARVLPGFLFLFVLQFGVKGTEFELALAKDIGNGNSVSSLFIGLAYVALCYLLGWSLRALRWPNLEEPIRKKSEREEGPSLSTRGQVIRLENPEAGFRLVKLRSEARLLETGRSGMWIAILLILLALSVTDSRITPISWILRLGLPLFFSLSFMSFEKRTWSHYYGNVEKLYTLIVEEGRPEKQNNNAT